MKKNIHSNLCPNSPVKKWTAKWIWVPEKEMYDWRNSYAFFRKTFTGSGTAEVRISADNRYELFLDGKRIGRGTASYDVEYQMFDFHCVELKSGRHVIAVIVHHVGEVCATSMKTRPGLITEVRFASGKKNAHDGKNNFGTDDTWKVMKGGKAFKQHLPMMMSHFGFYQVLDYRQVPEGWNNIGFDDTDWTNAEIIGKAGCKKGCAPWLRLMPRDIPNLAEKTLKTEKTVCAGTYESGVLDIKETDITVAVEMKTRKRKKYAKPKRLPVSLGKRRNEFIILDFSREVTGHLLIDFGKAQDGQQVDVGYDETLEKNGILNPRRNYVHSADRFYLRKNQKRAEVLTDVVSGT